MYSISDKIIYKDNNQNQEIKKIMKVLRYNNTINSEMIIIDSSTNFLNKIKPLLTKRNSSKNNNKIEDISFEKYEDNPNYKKTDDIVDNYIYQELIDKLDNRIKLIDDIIPLVMMTIIIVFIFTILYISYLEIII
jgi:hypothetical protein